MAASKVIQVKPDKPDSSYVLSVSLLGERQSPNVGIAVVRIPLTA